MMIVKFRSASDAKDTIKKLKKMHRFTKDLIECFEEKMEDEDDEDYRDDEDYYEDDYEPTRVHKRRTRYRRGM